MTGQFLKPAIRALFKRRSYSLLNLVGLSVGVGASLLIFLAIRNELTYDAHQSNYKDIYRVVSVGINRSNGEIAGYNAGVPGPMSAALKSDFPQFTKVASIWDLGDAQIYVPSKETVGEEKRFKEPGGLYWTEPALFEIFDYTWVAGSARQLGNPHTVVLCESMAKKFYGDARAAIGNTIQLWSFRIPLQIVGVFKDNKANSDVAVRMGASYVTLQKELAVHTFSDADSWNYVVGQNECFALLAKGQNIQNARAQIPAFVKKYYPVDPKIDRKPQFQAMRDVHLDRNFGTFKSDALSKTELWSLGLIGIFLLVVACINFINMATAQSVNRSKEVGVRKVLGGNRGQLMRQFLLETSLVVFVSLVVGALLAYLFVPVLTRIMSKELSMSLVENPAILLYLLITGLIVTLLAGFYPAVVLSGFQPATVFKYKVRTKAGGLYLRRGLVIFQLVIAQLLIIGTVVVIKQMQFFRNKPLGFDKDGIILINLPSDSSLKIKYPMLVNRMRAVPGVNAASLCLEGASAGWSYDVNFTYNDEATRRDFQVSRQFADTGYFNTFGLSLLAGRLPFASDTTRELVANETLVKKLGLRTPQDIIGQSISFDDGRKLPVVGVVKDFYSKPLREAISPLLISPEFNTYTWIAVRMNRANMSQTMGDVRKLFTGIYPTYMYDQLFFDENIERFYANEATTSRLFKIFSFIAILISSLGLYGLVSFMAVQKTKEVGIRKVLGASVNSIVFLFSREFTILIAVAFLIAGPLGYFFMHEWLAGFYYHTGIGVGVFLIALALSMFVAWVTVGYRAIRAAVVSPVKSLKVDG